MARPTRKHVDYGTLTESPQGRRFIRWTAGLMASRLPPEPVASFLDGVHLWVLREEGGLILWLETTTADGTRWLKQIGVRPTAGECVTQLEFVGRRWESWLESSVTGDRSIVDGPRSKRCKLEAERRAADAVADRVSATVTAADEAPATLCGVPLETLVAAVSVHEKRRPARLARRAKAYIASLGPEQRQYVENLEVLWREHEGEGWHVDIMRGVEETLGRFYNFDEALVAIESLLERYADSEEPLVLRMSAPAGDAE